MLVAIPGSRVRSASQDTAARAADPGDAVVHGSRHGRHRCLERSGRPDRAGLRGRSGHELAGLNRTPSEACRSLKPGSDPTDFDVVGLLLLAASGGGVGRIAAEDAAAGVVVPRWYLASSSSRHSSLESVE